MMTQPVVFNLASDYDNVSGWRWSTAGLEYETYAAYDVQGGILSAEEVAACNPAWPDLLSRLHAFHAEGRRNFWAPGSLLNIQLGHNEQTCMLQTLTGEQSWVWLLGAIANTPDLSHVTLEGCFYTLADTGLTKNFDVEDRCVERNWLDCHYPGWQERYLVAESLALSSTARTRFVLSEPSPVDALELPTQLQP